MNSTNPPTLCVTLLRRRGVYVAMTGLSLSLAACQPTEIDSEKGQHDTEDSGGPGDTEAGTSGDTAANDAPDTADSSAGESGDTDDACTVSLDAPLGTWTPNFVPDTNCSCGASQPSCHAIYLGRVDAVLGNLADLSFTKTTGQPPSVDVRYWLVVGAADEPSCLDLPSFVERKSGIWNHQAAILSLDAFPIWPSESDFEAAADGDTKKLFVITGGSDGPDQRTWFEKTSLTFKKTCP